MSMLFWKRISTKNFKFDSYTIAAAVIIVIAAALRVTLVALGWPPLDSDEATMGLMGMHIAFHGEWPIFFYGQGYMGAFEAYLAAIMFRLFGVSTFTLLLGGILLLLFCRRALLGWASICLVVALLIGALPMIIYNVYASPGQSTLSYILHVHSASGLTLPPKSVLYPLQLRGALLISLPL